MRVRVGARTDIGRARQRNEDAFLVQEPLFAVADGMGGHRGGNVASSLALEALGVPVDGPTAQALIQGVREANRRVLERGEADRELRGMGTTITALVADGGRAHLAHVGDSRAYRLRHGNLQQLTEDHTLVQRLVREGRLSQEEAATHPQRSILTRALGVEDEVEVDELTLDVQAGDRVLLCTDGLTSMVERDRIQDVMVTEPDPQAACDRLVEAANGAGGDDNITVVVLDFEEGEAGRREGSATEVEAPAGQGGEPPPAAGGGRSAGDLTGIVTQIDQTHAGASTDVTQVPQAIGGPAPPRRSGSGTLVGGEGEAGPAEPGTGRRRRGGRWLRVVVWVGVALAVVALALVGARIYIDRQWFVGVSNGRVAIYQGVPSTVLGYDLSHVEHSTQIPAAQAEQLAQWSRLDDGITARSLTDARQIVRQIQTDLQGTAG